MVPPIAALFFPQFSQPLDFNKSYRGHRIFGDHKTIRGILLGTLFAGLLYLLQKYLYNTSDFVRNISLIDYNNISLFFGCFQGLGALGGDAIKSFIKRQVNIKPGISWFPWDQIDWIIGTLAISLFFISISLNLAISYLVVGLALHIIVKGIGFIIKMNKTYI